MTKCAQCGHSTVKYIYYVPPRSEGADQTKLWFCSGACLADYLEKGHEENKPKRRK